MRSGAKPFQHRTTVNWQPSTAYRPVTPPPARAYNLRVRSLLSLILFLHVAAAAAASTVVTLERDGTAVTGGEVCRFAAGNVRTPIGRWLSSQQTTCVAAGSTLDLPPGTWNVFGRTDGAISTDPVLAGSASAPARLSLHLVPAATLLPTLPAGRTGVVYAPRRGIAYPVSGSRMAVPAAETLWLIAMEKNQPAAVFVILPIEAGTERTVDARGGGVGAAILAWLQFAEEDRAALATARGVSLPHVRMTQGGIAKDSDPLPPLEALDGALVLLRGAAAGDAEIDVGGRGWLSSRRRVKIERTVTVVSEPLAVRPAATLIVQWSTADDLVALNEKIGSCSVDKKRVPQFEISVASCPAQQRPNEPVDPATCRPVRQESFPANVDFGDLTVEDIPPGTYRAEMRFGNLPPVQRVVRVTAFQQAVARLQAHYFEIYGSLTRGGKALGEDASLTFPSGTGFAARESGEYHAALESSLEVDAAIRIASCESNLRATVLTDAPVRPRARNDIDIPDNELVVEVIDTFTRMPLPGASVRVTVFSLRMPHRPVLEHKLTTADVRGVARAVLTSVPEREIVINVSLSGYQKQVVAPFTMPRNERKTIEVQLVPLRGSPARIVSQREFDSGSVLWFSAAGEETERAELGPDGAFFYANAHGPDETMAVVSKSHPLWVVRAPSAARGQTLEIPFPDAAPPRTFEVTLAAADRQSVRHIGLAVRGLRVPLGALRAHQGLRNLPYVLRGPGPLLIRDVAETGPIEVVLGPSPEEVSRRVADPFALPQYKDAPRKRVEGARVEME